MFFLLLLGLLFLSLFQVSVLPLNFGFVAIFATFLIADKFNALIWLVIFSLLLALFGNLNFGLVLAAFAGAFLILEVFKVLTPENRLTNVLLIIAAFPVSTFSLLFFSKLLQ